MTLLVAVNLTLDDEISAERPKSSRQAPDATHQLRTRSAFLPADSTLSLQLISVCGWYSLGTCNPVLSLSSCKSITAFICQNKACFWLQGRKMTIELCCDLQAYTVAWFDQKTFHILEMVILVPKKFCYNSIRVVAS